MTAIAVELIYLAVRGIWTGRIRPIRFGRQSELIEIHKNVAPAKFWLWYVTYLILGLSVLVTEILRISGKLKLQ